jgi:hypothetical protein
MADAIYNYSGNSGYTHTLFYPSHLIEDDTRRLEHSTPAISILTQCRSVARRLNCSLSRATPAIRHSEEQCLGCDGISRRVVRKADSRFAAQRVVELTSDHTLVSLRMRPTSAAFPTYRPVQSIPSIAS